MSTFKLDDIFRGTWPEVVTREQVIGLVKELATFEGATLDDMTVLSRFFDERSSAWPGLTMNVLNTLMLKRDTPNCVAWHALRAKEVGVFCENYKTWLEENGGLPWGAFVS